MSEKSTRGTVEDIDHTHPHTDEPFGSSGVYDRGEGRGSDADTAGSGDSGAGTESEADRVPADVDGEGATDRVPADETATDRVRNPDRPRRMKDLPHTPPDEVGAQRTFDRGEEAPAGHRDPAAGSAADDSRADDSGADDSGADGSGADDSGADADGA